MRSCLLKCDAYLCLYTNPLPVSNPLTLSYWRYSKGQTEAPRWAMAKPSRNNGWSYSKETQNLGRCLLWFRNQVPSTSCKKMCWKLCLKQMMPREIVLESLGAKHWLEEVGHRRQTYCNWLVSSCHHPLLFLLPFCYEVKRFLRAGEMLSS